MQVSDRRKVFGFEKIRTNFAIKPRYTGKRAKRGPNQ
jgi:hypothetical protein